MHRIGGGQLAALTDAGFSAEEVLAMGTSAPAAYWGLDDLGALTVGREASFLVLDTDPRIDPGALATPAQVWIRGQQLR